MKSPHWVIILLGALVSSTWADERVSMPQNAVARRIDDFAVLEWDAVEGAIGYRIYRTVEVLFDLDAAGQIVPLDTPVAAFIPWSYVEPQEGATRLSVQVAPLDNDAGLWGISSEMLLGGEVVQSEIALASPLAVPTAAAQQSWGQVKERATVSKRIR